MLGNELGRAGLKAMHDRGERRRGGRLAAELLRCRMNGIGVGRVLDLSPRGMRLRSSAFVSLDRDAVFDVTLICHRVRLRLRARVAWTRRIGLIKREVGLRFLGVDNDSATELRRLAALAKHVAY